MTEMGQGEYQENPEDPTCGQDERWQPPNEQTQGNWQPPSHLQGPQRTEYIIFGAGGAVLAISPLLPWVTTLSIANFNLFGWTSATGSVALLPWGMLFAGIILAVMAFVGKRLTLLSRTAGIIVAISRGWSDGDIRRHFLDVAWKEVGDVANAPHHPERDVNAELFDERDARLLLILTAALSEYVGGF